MGSNPTNSIKNHCIDCGKEILSRSTRCEDCFHKSLRKTERPSREELKFLIRNMPFIQIGKKFGVSDNAIRKWCKNMDLPSSALKIKEFSD